MFNILNIEELQAGGALRAVTSGRAPDSVSNTRKFTPPIKDSFLQKKKKSFGRNFVILLWILLSILILQVPLHITEVVFFSPSGVKHSCLGIGWGN